MDNNISNLLMLDYIYLNILDTDNIKVKDNEYIFKNDIIYDNGIKRVYSSVSGKVLGVTNINNKLYVVINNDYKDKYREKLHIKKKIDSYKKEDINKLFKEFNINVNIDNKVLIINCIDKFIDEITYNYIFKNNLLEILDTIDALINILSIKKCYLCVSNSDSDLINILYNNMGTYPKIDLKIYTNDNVIGYREVLVKKIITFRYKKLGYNYFSIVDILNIYSILKKGICDTNCYLTIGGNLIDYKKVIKVNSGSNLQDILNELNIINNNIILNGLISGISLKDKNFIIDNCVRSIFIEKDKKYTKKECINCGMCINVCMLDINPKYMYFNNDKKAKEYKDKCINCGMCSYYCPSNIKLNKGCSDD